ncbi:5'/3'-nucleotidase SurE [Coxiella burnetii]|uniref:5'-nucleotidase SurE n=5 Tax=Coxiella burnetii TaxID=777 RepID=SURE_COXBU|nr:5'/3'-nucleotidase SurE [Coxiella burnetii]NP_820653.2 acid phosphatase [Coxiella burnetii RSA 493]A9N9U7.1 RecName: Full=5'-nucleotidase SurE; AltName: Full=Nucleoside 5'-monophosphate phosphohydrolase [Coxiella burnetii RSA 331]B6J3X6.1 RecName: Full=5'-nucleotidase SurE; AltName: Full=Nucleoside 5'-monophosphate phosphohydrolase [Coxiella burnetii CbuG_Q212]B6J4X6.1 RecName: Full=5'-nucleotidase SurE; AltName: Full=Nucleoside 5'-monophosphate phosphohydrolase [Coxiella burnetii CbuK_Q154]
MKKTATPKLRLLLSNDDGVYAKGLAILAKTLADLGEVDVVAPDRNRSGASNSLTLNAPLHIKNLENGMISVEGTPTDCVHLAITGVLPEMPDMVVAGINAGPNLGDDVWYSGTVAAAMEGRFLGLPALAVSLGGELFRYYETAAKVVYQLIQRIEKDPLPPSTILNINVPDLPYEELKGFEVTRLGTRHRAEPTIRQIDPRGHPIYWVGAAGPEQDSGPGTDFFAMNHHCVSITPLRVDLTHYEAFDQLASWVKRLEM